MASDPDVAVDIRKGEKAYKVVTTFLKRRRVFQANKGLFMSFQSLPGYSFLSATNYVVIKRYMG